MRAGVPRNPAYDILLDSLAAGGHHDLLIRAVATVLSAGGVEHAHVSLTLLEDDAMRRLNREHLGHDRPTDVIAFRLWEGDEPVVGDVYVGLDQAQRQAREVGVPPREELARLAVHGTLHVLGWEHPEGAAEREGSPMWRRQEELVRVVLDGEGS